MATSREVDVESASCYCGAVEVAVKGPVINSMICHCTKCRKYNKQMFNAVVMFPKGSMRVLKGLEQVVEYKTTPKFSRFHCGVCGGSMYEQGEGMEIDFVMLSLLLGDSTVIPHALQPDIHIYYPDRVVDVTDNLPKYHKLHLDLSASPPTPIDPMTDDEINADPRPVRL